MGLFLIVSESNANFVAWLKELMVAKNNATVRYFFMFYFITKEITYSWHSEHPYLRKRLYTEATNILNFCYILSIFIQDKIAQLKLEPGIPYDEIFYSCLEVLKFFCIEAPLQW